MVTVSIIIPVYNVEEYIEKCIESLIQQTFSDIEIIVVNDGSTDNSGLICDDMANKDSRIKVIHKNNQGVSSARNVGIKNSKGKYIHFVDADDTVEKNIIEKLVNKMKEKNMDLALCGYRRLYIEHGCKMKTKEYDVKHFEGSIKDIGFLLEHLLKNGLIQGPCWKLFKKEIIEKYNIKFPEEYSFGEDTIFVYKYLLYCKEISIVPGCLYNYIDHQSNSLSSQVGKDKMNTYLEIHQLLKANLLKHDICELKSVTDNLLCESIVSSLGEFYKPNYLVKKEHRYIQIEQIINNDYLVSKFKRYKGKHKQIYLIKYMLNIKNVLLIDTFFKQKKFFMQHIRNT